MIGVLLAVATTFDQNSINDVFADVHVFVTDKRQELKELIVKRRPSLLMLDTYNASWPELLAAYHEAVPYGYIVVIRDQEIDLDGADLIDEFWFPDTITAAQIRVLLKLARLNSYFYAADSGSLQAEEGIYVGPNYNLNLEPYLMDRARFISPGVWWQRRLSEWEPVLKHVTEALDVELVCVWPNFQTGEPAPMLAGKNNSNLLPRIVSKLGSTLAESGMQVLPLADGKPFLVSVQLEGAYYPVGLLREVRKSAQCIQQVAEQPSHTTAFAYDDVNGLAIKTLLLIASKLNREYLTALHLFKRHAFCQQIVIDSLPQIAAAQEEDTGVLLLDSDCNVISVNELALELLTSEGGSLDSALETLPVLDELLARAAQGKNCMVRTCIALPSAVGQKVAIVVAPTNVPYENSPGYIVTMQVEGDKQELNFLHQEQLASLASLAAGMAHELRNPLTTVRGFIQLLSKKLKAADLATEMRFADYILEELDRANLIVTEFLTLGKHKDELWYKVDLNNLLLKMLVLVEGQAVLQGITLTWQFARGLKLINARSEALIQVFLNIITNALQVTPKGGSIHIETNQVDEFAQVTISDTGPGMSLAVQKQIFTPFYSTRAEGTGLGLALSQQIIAEHQGEISVTSAVGEGTRFTVKIPFAPTSESI